MPVCRQFFNMATGSDWVLGPTFTPTFLSDPAPGSALVLFWGDQQTALAKVSPLSTVTSPGATWTAPPPGEQINYPATGTSNYSGVGLWIAENVSGATGGAVITATVGGYGLPADAEFWVGEFQNVTTTPFDKGATAFGHLTGSNKIVTAPAPSPTQAGEVFIICCCMHSISGDPTDAGWSNWTAGNPDQAVSYLIAPPTDSATHTDTFTTGATGDYYATASVLLLPMAAVAPIVAGVTPQWGTTAGGTEVLISGSGFSYASQVYFGAAAATSFTVLTDGLISAVAPAHAAGIVDITVVVVATSATSTLDQFTFQARPAGVGFSSGIGFSSTDTFSSKDTFSS
jgi:hypothetical protein